jgi:hypothetical protein
VIAALLPTLANSLFLFSTQIWLAKEVLPPITQLICWVDKLNQKLPNISAEKLHYLQKKKEFVEGPSRISETPHPYSSTHMRQVINIPGAVFLSLVFDENCSTSGAADFLQLFQDQQCSEPVAEIYYGEKGR